VENKGEHPRITSVSLSLFHGVPSILWARCGKIPGQKRGGGGESKPAEEPQYPVSIFSGLTAGGINLAGLAILGRGEGGRRGGEDAPKGCYASRLIRRTS